MAPSLRTYREVRPEIRDGDLLLFRRRGLIARAGRGIHSHAAKAMWWGKELFCVEMRELKGGRAVMLSSQVRRHRGRIDVYETNPGNRYPFWDREGSCSFMRRLAGRPYGYVGVLLAALLHMPVMRWFVPAATEDDARDVRPMFCSQACAAADRIGGGVDPVPGLADRVTEPCDLARSQFYRYRWTLA